MKTVNVTVRIDENLKQQADSLFSDLGLNITTAFNIFLRQAVREQQIPFVVSRHTPNADTLAAMEEVQRMKADPSVGTSYKTVEAMLEDILA